MSSHYNHENNKPFNPVKGTNFNPNWGRGEFTCMHTKAEKEGGWWQATFAAPITISKVQILNRGDCCGNRLNGAKIMVGD